MSLPPEPDSLPCWMGIATLSRPRRRTLLPMEVLNFVPINEGRNEHVLHTAVGGV